MYEKIVDAIAMVAFYNGWHDELCDIRDYIKEKANSGEEDYSIKYPDFLTKYDCDLYPRVIWSMLVLMFGDYGTSPRFGWIMIENAKNAIELIEELCALSDEIEGG